MSYSNLNNPPCCDPGEAGWSGLLEGSSIARRVGKDCPGTDIKVRFYRKVGYKVWKYKLDCIFFLSINFNYAVIGRVEIKSRQLAWVFQEERSDLPRRCHLFDGPFLFLPKTVKGQKKSSFAAYPSHLRKRPQKSWKQPEKSTTPPYLTTARVLAHGHHHDLHTCIKTKIEVKE